MTVKDWNCDSVSTSLWPVEQVDNIPTVKVDNMVEKVDKMVRQMDNMVNKLNNMVVKKVGTMASFQATVNRLEQFLDALDHIDGVSEEEWNITEQAWWGPPDIFLTSS